MTKQAIPLSEAQVLAAEVVERLRPACARIDIAGSIRRGKATVGDLEIVCQPTGDRLTLADELLAQGVFEKRHGWGDRAKFATYKGVNLDLFVSLADRQYACTLWLRTGGADANHLMVTQHYKGGILPDNLVFCAEQFWRLPAPLASYPTAEVEACKKRGSFAPLGGECLTTPTEADVFALVGLPNVPPAYRDERTYRALAGRRLVAFGDVAHLWDARSQAWALPQLQYIGRVMPNQGLPASDWGNPFKLARDTPEERANGVSQYRTHIAALLERGTLRLDDLRGKTLVCWCKTLEKPDAICHGDVLLDLLGEAGEVKAVTASDSASAQLPMFSAAWQREMEYHAAVIADARGTPKKAAPAELFDWRTPWLTSSGHVWIHVGYGEWQQYPVTHERAEQYLRRMRDFGELYVKAQRERLEAFLVARATVQVPAPAVPVQRVMALSLWQPWAMLVAIGAKGYETRHWQTSFRGDLVIHAAKKRDREVLRAYENLRPVMARLPMRVQPLVFGAALCVVRLVDCIPTEVVRESLSDQERTFGNYASGRFAWQFEDVRAFPEAVPYRGKQGMWQWDLPLPERFAV